MSISDNYVPLKELGNGVTTQFSSNWDIVSLSFIQVFLEDVVTGVQTLVEQGGATDEYTVVFDSSGFVVTFNTSPTSSNFVVIARDVSINQGTPYKTSKGFDGRVTEASFDKLTAVCQDQQDEIDRTLKYPLGSSLIGVLPTDPTDGFGIVFDGVTGAFKKTSSNLETVASEAEAAKIAAEAAQAAAELAESGADAAQASAAIDAAASAASAAESAASVGGIRVSPDDTTPSNLEDKLLVGSGLSLSTQNDGADETRTIDLDISGVAVGVPAAGDTLIFTDASDSNTTKKFDYDDLGGGGLVPIQTQTVTTAVASVDFTSGIDGTYKTYVVVFNEVTVSSSSSLNFRLSTDAGATFISSSNYSTGRQNQDTQATTYSQSNQNNISQFLGANVGNDATDLSNGIVYFFGMGVSGIPSLLYDVIAEQDAATANSYKYSGFGTYKSNILPNGIRFYVGSTFTAGTFTLYGLAGA